MTSQFNRVNPIS